MTKYSAERVAAICKHIAAGVPITHAPSLAGVSYPSFAEWRQNFSEVSEAVRAAEASLIKRKLARIEQAGKDGAWQADAWTLERRFPEHFGRAVAGIYPAGDPAHTVPITRVVIEAPGLPAHTETGGDDEPVPNRGPGPDPLPAPRPLRRAEL